jgi:hypothetical protein
MPELTPAAITYAAVKRAYKEKGPAEEAWRKIGEVTGAGNVPPSEDATIDLTGMSESVRERVAKISTPAVEETPAKEAADKKGGK